MVYKGEVPPPTRTIRRRETVTVQGTPPEPPSVLLPTAQKGIPVPYIAGRQRIFSPNIMWYGNLQPRYRIDREVKTEEIENIYWVGGIKIIEIITVETIVETKTVVGYSVDMQLGLCLGPGVKLRAIYEDGAEIWTGNIGPARTTLNVQGVALDQGEEEGTPVAVECIFSGGEFDQAPDPYLLTKITTGVPGYVGIAHFIIKNLDITKGVRNLQFEVERFPNPLGLSEANNRGGDDINLMSFLHDYLTSEWGGAGLSATSLIAASFESAALTLAAEENFGSIYIQQDDTPQTAIEIVQDQVRGYLFHNPTEGKLDFALIRSEAYEDITGPIFNHDNIHEIRDIEKVTWEGVVTQVRGTYTKRSGNYAPGALTAQALSVNTSLGRKKQPMLIDYPAAMTSDVVVQLISRDISLNSVPYLSGVMEADRSAASLLPGDGFIIDDPTYGFSSFKAFVKKRRSSPRGTNRVIIEFEQAIRPTVTAIFTPGDDGLFDPVDPNPHAPTAVRFLDTPSYHLIKQAIDVRPDAPRSYPLILAHPYSSVQKDFDAYISNVPGTTGNQKVLTGASYPTIGKLSLPIDRYDSTDTGELPFIDIYDVTRDAWLQNVGEAGTRSGRLFAYINTEILSFESYYDLGAGGYRLNNVHRGLLDTVAEDHDADDFVYIIGNTYDYIARSNHTLPPTYTPAWKLVGNGPLKAGEIADALNSSAWVPADRHTLPSRPHNLRIDDLPRSATPIELEAGTLHTAYFSTRSRTSIVVALQLDAAEPAERNSEGVPQVHRVLLRDSANVTWDLGETPPYDLINELDFVIPLDAEDGIGYIWVQAENEYGVSLYRDELPVDIKFPNLTEETEDGLLLVTEDNLLIITEDE
jgi:hypothetical protein